MPSALRWKTGNEQLDFKGLAVELRTWVIVISCLHNSVVMDMLQKHNVKLIMKKNKKNTFKKKPTILLHIVSNPSLCPFLTETNEGFIPVCPNVAQAERVDCFPEPGASQVW